MRVQVPLRTNFSIETRVSPAALARLDLLIQKCSITSYSENKETTLNVLSGPPQKEQCEVECYKGKCRMVLMRSQWPHTVSDIVKSLDGVWGIVGATDTNGNLIRLERSLHEPLTYKVTEYDGVSEDKVAGERTYQANEKEHAVKHFAKALGFDG